MKKKVPIRTFLTTRPLHRKQKFFLVWPIQKDLPLSPTPEAESGRPCFVYEPLRPDQVKHLKHPSTTSQPDKFFIYFPTLPKTTDIHIAFWEIRRLDGVSETHEKVTREIGGRWEMIYEA